VQSKNAPGSGNFCLGDVEMTDQAVPQGETPASEAPVTDAKQTPSTTEMAAELERTRIALKAANKEAAERRKRLEELEAAETKRKDSEMSELDKLKKALAEKDAMLTGLQRAQAQRQAAEKTGLPAVFADRLKGETPEEMEADAKAILAALPKPAPPQVGATNPGSNATGSGETIAQQRARIYGSGGDAFNPVEIAKQGGGVIYTTKTE
jgi:NAD-specific glutamate dehydrogenase